MINTKELNVIDFLQLNYDAIIESLSITENSKKTYKSNGKDFVKFVVENGINENTYKDYKIYIKSKNDIKGETKKQRLITAKAILIDLYMDKRLLSCDLTKGIKNLNYKYSPPKEGLTKEECEKVIEYINSNYDELKRVRINTMLNMILYDGIGQIQLCNILIDDLLLNDRKIKIICKGSDVKYLIDIHQSTCNLLESYLKYYHKKSGYLFTSEKGTTIGQRLTERGIRKIFENIFDKLNIPHSANGFKNRFSAQVIEYTNENIESVKQFSSHKNIGAMSIYEDIQK